MRDIELDGEIKRKRINVELDIPLAIIQNNDLLLFQRRNKEPYKNLLGLLGGKKREREDLATALKREILEESGLEVISLKLLGIVREKHHDNDHIYNFNLHIFHVNCLGTLIHNKEEGKVIWTSVKEFKSFKKDFIPSDWLIVKNFLNKSFKDFCLSVFKSNKVYSIIVTN